MSIASGTMKSDLEIVGKNENCHAIEEKLTNKLMWTNL